jgi:hypothetical protein
MSWRDHLKIHPSAELFPLMSEGELRELGEDIKKNGLRSPIIICKGRRLLDGRNRLDAMELVGLKFEIERNYYGYYGFRYDLGDDELNDFFHKSEGIREFKGEDPYAFVLSANLHRRHLTGEQKRDLIAKVLKAKPEASNRQIATQVKADHKTVAAVRNDLESVGEIPHLEKTVGADGKQYKSRSKKKLDSSLDKLFEGAARGRVTESAEVSIEDRRGEMARLDDPAESVVDEVDKRVSCVTNTILRHVGGLSRGDAERFFTALRDRLDDLERQQLRDEVAEGRSEHEIPGDLSVPDFLRRAPA